MCYIDNTGYYKEQMENVIIKGMVCEVLQPDGKRFCVSCGYDSDEKPLTQVDRRFYCEGCR